MEEDRTGHNDPEKDKPVNLEIIILQREPDQQTQGRERLEESDEASEAIREIYISRAR